MATPLFIYCDWSLPGDNSQYSGDAGTPINGEAAPE